MGDDRELTTSLWSPVTRDVAAGIPRLDRTLPFTVPMFPHTYRVLPHARIASFDALPDALPAGFPWEVVRRGVAFHAGEFACQDLVYGALAAAIVVLLWS